ncbi:hypothetical protein BGZ68_003447 [Mortierella alpina]|nr:hypothetical protein BGZ68_003447 [Mortierella alpina]
MNIARLLNPVEPESDQDAYPAQNNITQRAKDDAASIALDSGKRERSSSTTPPRLQDARARKHNFEHHSISVPLTAPVGQYISQTTNPHKRIAKRVRGSFDNSEQGELRNDTHENTSSPSTDNSSDVVSGPDAESTPTFKRNADGKYRCTWPSCGKEFSAESRLVVHYRIHLGKPPYPCDYQGCTKAFHTSSSLSHHRVVHTDQGLRPFVCRHNKCGATYTQLARLITHQRTTHSGMIMFTPPDVSASSAAPSPRSVSPTHPSSDSSQPKSTANSGPHMASYANEIESFEEGLEGQENEDESEQMRLQREAAVTMTMFSRSATSEGGSTSRKQ